MTSTKRRATSHQIKAEMVASVLEVRVEQGRRVQPGETLLLLESMKMEIPVLADVAGTVSAVTVATGDVVQEGDPLVVLDL